MISVHRASCVPGGSRSGPACRARVHDARDTRAGPVHPARVHGVPDAGSVTAELALALPAVVLVLALLLVTASAASVQLRCADAARAGARVAALGQSDAEVVAVARRVAGRPVDVVVEPEAPWVVVRVSARLPGSWFTGSALQLSGEATSWQEPR